MSIHRLAALSFSIVCLTILGLSVSSQSTPCPQCLKDKPALNYSSANSSGQNKIIVKMDDNAVLIHPQSTSVMPSYRKPTAHMILFKVVPLRLF